MKKLLLLTLLVLVTAGTPQASARPIQDPPANPPASSVTARPDWQPLLTGGVGAMLGAFSVVLVQRRRRPQLAQ